LSIWKQQELLDRRNLWRLPEGFEGAALRTSSVATSTVFCKTFLLLSCKWKGDSSRTSRKDVSAYQAKVYYVGMTKFTKSRVETQA